MVAGSRSGGGSMPSLVIVDDSVVIRRAVRNFLALGGFSWEICGEAGDAETGFQLCHSLQPDVVLIDLSLSQENGLSLAMRVKEQVPGTRIVIMSEQAPQHLEILTAAYDIQAVAKSMLASRL